MEDFLCLHVIIDLSEDLTDRSGGILLSQSLDQITRSLGAVCDGLLLPWYVPFHIVNRPIGLFGGSSLILFHRLCSLPQQFLPLGVLYQILGRTFVSIVRGCCVHSIGRFSGILPITATVDRTMMLPRRIGYAEHIPIGLEQSSAIKLLPHGFIRIRCPIYRGILDHCTTDL